MTHRSPLFLLFLACLPLFAAVSARAQCRDYDETHKMWMERPCKDGENPDKPNPDGTDKDGNGTPIQQGKTGAGSSGLASGLAGTAQGSVGGKLTQGLVQGGVPTHQARTVTANGHAGGHNPDGSGDPNASGTEKLEVLLARINADAAKFAAERPDLAQFARTSAERVSARIKGNPNAVFTTAELDAYITMMRLQAQKADNFTAMRNRQPPPTPEEFRAMRAKYERDAEQAMRGVPHGDLMNAIHEESRMAWYENWRGRNDPDPDGGRPSRTHIDGMLQRNPRSPGNWSLDAADKLANGDKAAGMESLNRSIGLGGTPEAFGMRGALRLDAKDYDGAYQDAKKALELKPGDKDAMGILRSAEGRTSPGVASAGGFGAGGAAGDGRSGAAGGAYGNQQAAAAGGFGGFNPGRTRDIPGMTPASTLSSNQKLEEARRALSLGDMQAAIALANRALELNSSNAGAYGFLSGVYASKGDYARAVSMAESGLGLSPRDPALLNAKAFAENRSKRYRDALGTSNAAIEADARNAVSYANRAYAHGGLGDRASMMSDINRAAGIDPRFEKAAADAAALQLPSNADILFMFPGENPPETAAAAPAARGRSFGLVVGAGVLGGLLVALGLLSTVLAPVKESVVSAFTRATRRGPSVHALEEESTPEAPASPAPVSGLIRGQYEISRQIGAGGMGTVYEGTDRSLGRRVAIKKMRDELRMNPRERERFVIEAKTVASLRHENIVDIYAIAEEGDDVYLVFEFVDGKTIHDLVQSKGRLNQADSARVARAIADALTYAHSRGVIHRDMKPSNVMVTADGRIKVMDFGIARMAKDALTRYSMTNTVVGTPPYMAPEQEQGVVRKESDVYALAVCAYEMLTGKLPFIGVGAGMLMNKINMSYIPPSRAIAGLPEALDEVFLKSFQADPDQRFRSPSEFSAALERALGGARSGRST